MNKIRLGKCIYNPTRRELISDTGNKTILSHQPAELLELLYQNSDRYISIGELEETIWKGKYVDPKTIMRSISDLRKRLSPKSSVIYIENKSNVGYKFVQPVSNIELFPYKSILSYLLVFISIVGVYQLINIFNREPVLQKATPITSLKGQESFGAVSGNSFVFSHKAEGSEHWNLQVKSLDNERYFRLTNGKFDDRNPAFSPDGSKLAFNRFEAGECKIMVAEFNHATLKPIYPNNKYTCAKNLQSVSVSWKDSNTLYISISMPLGKPYSIHELDLNNSTIKGITSPNSGAGDYFLTYSAASENLLYLRNHGGNTSSINIYDTNQNTHRVIKTVPNVLFSLSWLEKGTSIVYRSSNDTLSYFNIDDPETIIPITIQDNPVRLPFLIDEKTVGFTNGTLVSTDVISFKEGNITADEIFSSFQDSHPSIAYETGDMAFLSDRTGVHDIWVKKIDGALLQVTAHKESFYVQHLAISPNGNHIAYTINNQILLTDTTGNLIYSSDDGVQYVNPTFSNDSKSIYYAMLHDEKWHIERRELSNISTAINLTEGNVAIECRHKKCLFVSNTNNEYLFLFNDGKLTRTDFHVGHLDEAGEIVVTESNIFLTTLIDNQMRFIDIDIESNKYHTLTPTPSNIFTYYPATKTFYTTQRRKTEVNIKKVSLPKVQ